MKSPCVPTFADVLSTDRFDTYRLWADGDEALAVRLYTFNVQLSAVLYGLDDEQKFRKRLMPQGGGL